MKEHVRIFSGSAILVDRLKSLLYDAKIGAVIKDNVQSATFAGFGSLGNSIDLFILDSDLEKATDIIESFHKEITQ